MDVNHDYFMINLENLIGKQYVKVWEHSVQELLFLIKCFEKFLSYGIKKVTSAMQTEEVNRSSGRDDIVEGKEKETELVELENFFDNVDILTAYACSMNGCYQTYNKNHFFRGKAKTKRWSFRRMLTFATIEARRQWFSIAQRNS